MLTDDPTHIGEEGVYGHGRDKLHRYFGLSLKENLQEGHILLPPSQVWVVLELGVVLVPRSWRELPISHTCFVIRGVASWQTISNVQINFVIHKQLNNPNL